MLAPQAAFLRTSFLWLATFFLLALGALQVSEVPLLEGVSQEVSSVEQSIEPGDASPCGERCSTDGISCTGNYGTLIHASCTFVVFGQPRAVVPHNVLPLWGRSVGVDPEPPK